MAGDWLKMRHDLADDPAVIRLATLCGLEEDAVIGKLFRLWSWADRHSKDGQVEGLDLAWVDRLTRSEGFGTALVRVGWLVATESGLCFPRFDRHCSDTAKTRALGRNRAEAHRNAASVTPSPKAVTLEALPEKRREEIHLPPRESFAPEAWKALLKAWNAGPGKPWRMSTPPPPTIDRLTEADWMAAYPAGIAKLGTVRFFRNPVTLRQFCGIEPTKGRFLDRLLGGEFDNLTARPGRGDFGDGPPPPKVWTGEVAQAFDRTRQKLAALRDAP
jgi:hypothetical protein